MTLARSDDDLLLLSAFASVCQFDVTKLSSLSLSMNCTNTVTKRLQCCLNCSTNFHLQMNCKQHVLWVQGLTLFFFYCFMICTPVATKYKRDLPGSMCHAYQHHLSINTCQQCVSPNSYWCSESCKNKIPLCHI